MVRWWGHHREEKMSQTEAISVEFAKESWRGQFESKSSPNSIDPITSFSIDYTHVFVGGGGQETPPSLSKTSRESEMVVTFFTDVNMCHDKCSHLFMPPPQKWECPCNMSPSWITLLAPYHFRTTVCRNQHQYCLHLFKCERCHRIFDTHSTRTMSPLFGGPSLVDLHPFKEMQFMKEGEKRKNVMRRPSCDMKQMAQFPPLSFLSGSSNECHCTDENIHNWGDKGMRWKPWRVLLLLLIHLHPMWHGINSLSIPSHPLSQGVWRSSPFFTHFSLEHFNRSNGWQSVFPKPLQGESTEVLYRQKI